MKKILFLFALVLFAACSSSDNEEQEVTTQTNPIIGTWLHEDLNNIWNYNLTFTKEGYVTYEHFEYADASKTKKSNSQSRNGKWSAKNASSGTCYITWNDSDAGGASKSQFQYTIVGDSMYTNLHGDIAYVRVK